MKLIQTLTLITWFLVMLVACGGTSPDQLNSTAWELYSIGKYSPIAGSETTIHFDDGQVNGSSGCNSYGGIYQMNGNRINFQEVESTLMDCIDPLGVMEQETTFLNFLWNAQTFEIIDDQLRISRSDGETLIFTPAK